MKKEFFGFISIIFILVFLSHAFAEQKYSFSSGAKKDYEKLSQLQQDAEQSFLETHDFDIKIKSCDNIINSLNQFIKKYPKDKWGDTATTALETWTTKKSALVSQENMLIMKLSSLLSQKAREAAQKKHKMSNVESFDLASQEKHIEGDKLNLINTYSVRMKGKLLGKSIYKLSISTSGSINIEDKMTTVNDNAQVEE